MFCKIFIYVHKNLFAPQTWDLLEKFALNFLYNFHRERGLIKLMRKKVIAENQCEKHKKSSLVTFANSSHPDKDQQNVVPDLGPDGIPEIIFWTTLNQQSKKYPACKEQSKYSIIHFFFPKFG